MRAFRFFAFVFFFIYSFGAVALDINEKGFAPPSATIDYVEGSMEAGFDLTVNYTYVPNPNPEGATQIQWFVHNDVFSPGTPISGATSATFTLTNAHIGLHISVQVTPVDNTGTAGAPVIYYPSWNLGDVSPTNPVLPSDFSCGRAGSGGAPAPANDLKPNTQLCSPRLAEWEVTYTGINYNDKQTPHINIDWGDGTVETFTATLINPEETNQGLQQWQATPTHIYDYDDPSNNSPDDGSCTYELTTWWSIRNGAGVTTANCRNADQTQTYAVWDDLDNPNIGTKDINHDPTSTGGEVGETVEVCEGDTNPIRLLDNSDFNCTPPIETLNPNDETRWIQWVYGSSHNITTGAGPDEKIIIDSIPYDAADFPLYGEPQLLAGPVTVPNGITDDIQMPISAINGEIFTVTLRSWNTCNKFSVSGNDLLGPQAPPFNVFDIYSPGGTVQDGSTPPLYANDDPVTRTFDIVIVAKPLDPVPNHNTICEGEPLPNFHINFTASSSSVNWYEDNSGVPGNVITNSTFGNNSKNLSPDDYAPGGPISTNTPGVYTVWASYIANTGSQDCESDPVAVTLTIKEDLSQPGPITGSSQVCNGANNVAFSLPSSAGSTTVGGAVEYEWSSTGGGGVVLDATTGQNITVDFNIGGSFESVTRTIRVRRIYPSNPQCPSPYRTFEVTIFGETQGGNTNPDDEICEGESTGTIQLTGHRGTILRWERSDNGGPFSDIGSAGNDTFSESLGTAGTYEYRAVIENGVCATEMSTITTIEVNPYPNTPTISISGGNEICDDGSTTLTANSNAAADSYQWFKDGSPLAGETSSSITVNDVGESGSYTVEAYGISPTLCASGLSAAEVITVYPLPSATVSGGGSICAGNPAPDITWTFTGTPPFNFEIDIPVGANIIETGYPGFTYTIPSPTDGGTYELIKLEDSPGISCLAAGLGGPAVVNVIATPPPSIESFTPGAAVCDDGASTTAPSLTLDLAPNSSEDYDITYEIRNSSSVLINTNTISVTSNGSGLVTISPDYVSELGQTPDTYEIRITAIVNTNTLCNADGLPSSENITVNPRPADPANPVDNVACSSEATGAMLSVDDPGAGNLIIWYTDATRATVASGATSGTRNQEFTPTSTATATYFAVTESQTSPTNCQSVNATVVKHTQDDLPSPADADDDDDPEFVETCNDELALGATPADSGGEGAWSGPSGVIFSDVNDPNATVSGLSITGGVPTTTTLTWTVNSALGACSPTSETVDVIRLPLPEANDITDELCEDLPQGSDLVAGVDLTIAAYSDAITGITGSTNRTIEYFTDPGRTTLVPDETNVDVNDGTTIYVTVTDEGTSSFASNYCTNNAQINFTVNTLPDAINVSGTVETTFCEETVASLTTKDDVDLTTLDNDVANNLADRSVEWFADPGTPVTVRGDLTGFEISDYTDVDGVGNGDIFYAIVIDDNTLCEDISSVEFTINPRPDDNPIQLVDGTSPSSLSVCSGSTIQFLQIDDALNPGSTYSWNVPTGPGELVLVGGTNGVFIGFKAPGTIPAPGVTIEFTETYTSTGCTGNTQSIQIIVDDAPPAPTIDGPSDVCTNQQNVLYEVSPSNPTSTYTWDIGSLGSIVSGQGTSSIIVNIGLNSDQVEVTETNATGCQSPPAVAVNVTVNDRPNMNSPSTHTMCSGEQVNDGTTAPTNLIFSSDVPGSTFAWEVVSKTGSVGGATVGATGTGNIPHVLTNTSGATGSVIYEVTPQSPALCLGPTQVVTVTVESQPLGADDTRTICSGEAISYDIQVDNINALGNNLPSEFTYTVESSDEVNIPTPVSLDRTTASAAYISDTYTNTTTAPIDIRYTIAPIEVLSGRSCVGMPFDVVFTINNEPVGADDAISTCSGDALTYNLQDNVNTLGNSVGSTFTWFATANGSVTGESTTPQNGVEINDNLINVSGTGQVVEYTVIPSHGINDCDGDAFTIEVTVFSQPEANNIAIETCSNDPLSFDLDAHMALPPAGNGNGVNSTFQWVATDNTELGVTGESITLQSSSMIDDNLRNTTGTDQDVVYTVIPTETVSGNSCVGEPFEVTVTIHPEPAVSNGAGAVCSDGVLHYDLQGLNITNGIASSFEWVAASDVAGVAGESLMAKTGDYLNDTLTNLSGSNQVVTYNVTPTSESEGCEGATFQVEITVRPEPVGFDDAIAECSNVALSYDLQDNIDDTFNGGNSVVSNFTWMAADNPDVSGESLSPQAGGTIDDVITNNTPLDQDVIYMVTPTSVANGCPGDPFIVTVTIQSNPVGFDDNVTVCSDEVIDYGLQANINNTLSGGNGVSSTFEWVATDNPLVTGESLTVQSSDTISNAINNFTGSDQVVVYTVTPTDDTNGCVGAPFEIQVTVKSEPRGQDDTRTVCSDEVINYDLQANINALGGNGMTSSFEWVAIDNPDPDVIGESTTLQTGNIINDTITNTSSIPQDIVYTVTPTAGGCEGDDFFITVTVRPEPVGTDDLKTICSRESVAYDLQLNIDGSNSLSSTFTWVAASNPLVSGESTTLRNTNTINDVLVNNSGSQQTVLYTITPTGVNGCDGDPFELEVTIDSEPLGFNDTYTECSDEALNYNLQANVSNTGSGGNDVLANFTWTVAPNPNVTIATATPQPSDVIADVITNTSGTDQVVSYTVTPESDPEGCIGDPFIINVTITSEPNAADRTIDICSRDEVDFSLPDHMSVFGNGIISDYTWVVDTDNPDVSGESTTPQSDPVIYDTLINNTGSVQSVDYRVTPVGNNACTGDDFIITVNVISEPVGVGSSATFCSNEPFTINPQDNVDDIGNGGNSVPSTFTWTAMYDGGLTGGAFSGSGDISETLRNQTDGPLAATYTVTPRAQGGNCPGGDFIITVTINEEPVQSNIFASQCSDVPIGVLLPDTDNDGGNITSYDITAFVDSDLTEVAPVTQGTGITDINAIAGDIFTNPESTSRDVIYTVTPYFGTCAGANFTIVVSINPEPVGNGITLSPFCSREQFNIDPQSHITNNVPSSFTWTASYPAGITNGAGSGNNNIVETLINDTGGQLIVDYTVIPTSTANNCEGDQYIISLPIDPSPVAIDQNPVVCSDVASTEVAAVDLTTLESAIMGGASNTVTWYQDEFLNAPVSNPTTYSAFNGIPVYAEVSDGTCQNIAVVNYTIEPLPQISGSVTSDYNGNDLSCLGATDGEITVIASGATGPYTYELFIDDGTGTDTYITTGLVNITGVFTGIGTGVYQVEVTDDGSANSCLNTSFPIVLSEPFELSGGFVFGPQNICEGETPAPLTQIAQPFGGIGNYTFQWQESTDGVNFTDIAGATSSTYAPGPLTNGSSSALSYFYRRVVGSGTCADVISNDGDPIEIIVNPTPTASFDFYLLDDIDADFSDPLTAPGPLTAICEGEPFFVRFEFQDGTAPFRFDYDENGSEFYTDEFGVGVTPVIYFEGIEEDLTINLTRLEDVFGCDISLSISKTIDVLNINPDFTPTPVALCSGEAVIFDFEVDGDVEYVFNFGDGTPEVTIGPNDPAFPPGPNQISHTYNGGSLIDVTYPVTMTTEMINTAPTPNCTPGPVVKSISLYANVFANIQPEKVSICSGESILFKNQSQGVINHRWYYREQGTTEVRDERTTSGDQTFTFTNTTSNDPIIYEVVYEANNGNCEDGDIIEIEVYKAFDADFGIASVTEYIAGEGYVTLDNNTTPVPPDDSYFSYEWNFGLDALPQSMDEYDPTGDDSDDDIITYTEPGTKNISLTVINNAAAAAGIGCSDTDIETVDIVLPPITAEFTIDPTEGCSRLTVNVTSNTSQGANKFEWSVLDRNDNEVATSTETTPSFILITPGEYRVFLTASFPSTGQTVTSGPQFVTVYENPVARFEVPQTVVYIPDDAFRPLNRSEGAESFEWDFGDGTPLSVVPRPEHYYELPNEDPGYLVMLTAINQYNCTDLDSARVRVEEGGYTKTPNAFTPNPSGPTSGIGGGSGSGSELNDIFLPITEGVEQFHMWIFDRWGNLIFESDDKRIGWDGYDYDGRLLPAGVYVYKLELTLSNGQRTTRIGDVTLIR